MKPLAVIYICCKKPTSKEDKSRHWSISLENLLKAKHTIVYRPTRSEPSDTEDPGDRISTYEPQAVFKELATADAMIVNLDELDAQSYLELLYSKVQGRRVYAFKRKFELNKLAEVVSLLTDSTSMTPEALAENIMQTDSLRRRSLSDLKELLLSALQDELWEMFQMEDKTDPAFRSAVLTSQFGNLMRYMTHDKEINPNARPIGSRGDEIAQAGDAIIQLVMYLISRDLQLSTAYDSGIVRMREEVWRDESKEGTEPLISDELRVLGPDEIVAGIAGCSGTASGPAVIVRSVEDTRKLRRFPEGCIVIMDEYEDVVWDNVRNALGRVKGVVVEVGSENIHVAIVCREYRRPCIVGARNATDIINERQMIELDVAEHRGVVRRKKPNKDEE